MSNITSIEIDDLVKLPSAMVLDLIEHFYHDKKLEVALSLAKAVPADKMRNQTFGVNRLIEKMVAANDLVGLNALKDIFTSWTGASTGMTSKSLGGIAVAVLTNNMEMLEVLRQSGAKADNLSPSEACKHDTTLKNVRMSPGYHSDASYEGRSAFSWALLQGHTEMADKLMEYWPEACVLTKTTTKQNTGPRGGYRASTQVVAEDAIFIALEYNPKSFEWLYKKFNKEVSDYFVRNPSYFNKYADVLTREQQDELWQKLNLPSQNDWNKRTPVEIQLAQTNSSGSINRTFIFELIENHPERFLDLYGSEKVKVDLEIFKRLCANAPLDVVEPVYKRESHLVDQTWIETPTSNSRIKRMMGVLQYALHKNQNADVIDFLATPERIGKEKAMIESWLSMNWSLSIDSLWSLSSSEREAKEKSVREQIKTVWDRVKLRQNLSELKTEKNKAKAL